MVEAGVSGVSPDKYKFRPVQLAAQNGHTEVVRWLEEQGYAWPPPELEEEGAESSAADLAAAAREDRTERLVGDGAQPPEPASNDDG